MSSKQKPISLRDSDSPARLRQVAARCTRTGAYLICPMQMPPAFVLARLLDILGVLDPDAHARLTASGSSFRSIPPAAMDDPHSRWWSTPPGTLLLTDIVTALNTAAQPAYVCDLDHDGHIALVPLPATADAPPPSNTRYRYSRRP